MHISHLHQADIKRWIFPLFKLVLCTTPYRPHHVLPLACSFHWETPRERPVIHYKEINMNWDIVEGNWKQFKGKIKAKWGKLSDDNLDVISGKRDQLAGKIQETYGVSKDEAEKQIEDFEKENQDIRH
jgi:uncharacterized protein YjbJ (UPF0337 family)